MNETLKSLLLVAAALAANTACAGDAATVERGRYLVGISGCNDCHTAGYAETGGNVPEAQRLTGVPVGFSGPWGTSYPSNLRLVAQQITSDEQWLAVARTPRRPPMPWFALRDMSDADLKAIYAYLRSLGPAGGPAPAAVAPGQAPTTPYIVFVPQAPAPAGAKPAAGR